MLAMFLAMLESEEDQRRFTKLYEAYEKKVYAVALRILGDPVRAEDAVEVEEKGGFPRAVGPHNRNFFALGNVHAHTVQGPARLVIGVAEIPRL